MKATLIETPEKLSTCRKMGGVMEALATDRYGLVDTLDIYLHGKTAQRVYEEDLYLIGQGLLYIKHDIEDELTEQGLKKIAPDKQADDPDIAYWAGYLYTYWMLAKSDEYGVIKDAPIRKILEQYDILHTQSCTVAIDMIKEMIDPAQNARLKG